MKIFLLLFLAVIVFVFAVGGCGAEPSPTATSAPTSPPPMPTSAPPTPTPIPPTPTPPPPTATSAPPTETPIPPTPTRTPRPTRTPTATTTPRPTLPPGAQVTTFSIVYNNVPYDSALMTAWGFACLVQTEAGTVLFDTGGDGGRLLRNMEQLGLDPQAIDAVVLSHIHADHTGGLERLLDTGVRPTVYVPAAFPAAFKDRVRERTELVEVTDSLEILPGMYSTGEVRPNVVEQALVVETGEGVVVLTGCSHPGVVNMVRQAQEVVAGEIALVTGGFHLGEASRAQIRSIITDLKNLGVRQAVPSHCSGDLAMEMFAEAFDVDFVAGLGWIASMEAE